MGRDPRRMKVKPGSELARLLEAARGDVLLLEKDDELYRIVREMKEEDISGGYDPEKVREALAETAGSWADIDTDSLIAEIYRAREQGSRPASRP